MIATDIFLYDEFFKKVQMSNVFTDSKTFVDAIPLFSLDEINSKYNYQSVLPGFDLKKFVFENFGMPLPLSENNETGTADKDIITHLEALWDQLTRQPLPVASTLINLPEKYIVPGGRFREIYYWDSYFTMLGLQVSKRYDLIESMVENFAFLIEEFGYIPNGNRTYYLGRSQPPFFTMMVLLLQENSGNGILKKYLPHIQKEYNFWMKGTSDLQQDYEAVNRVIKLPGGYFLNRYWDEHETPRPESYKEDHELAAHHDQPQKLYRNIRAAAESGWDFSSRWFKNGIEFSTIHTTDILPVDLNCLLFMIEQTLAAGYTLTGEKDMAEQMKNASLKRAEAIQIYFWVEAESFYFDYNFVERSNKRVETLAAVFPLFFKLANNEQAAKVAQKIDTRFIKDGGVITTSLQSSQQWDAPNGWAPLQWITVSGLKNYNYVELAESIAKKWLALNEKVYRQTGKMMEKYNVMDTSLIAGGGEYPAQDGFGWTNGVYLALNNWLKLKH